MSAAESLEMLASTVYNVKGKMRKEKPIVSEALRVTDEKVREYETCT